MSIFKLQKFSLNQSLSGMKVCSDSLLFGAMIPIEGASRILDIGAGTGILSLMQAQKLNSSLSFNKESDSVSIIAVELTEEGAFEAAKNFKNSPWSNQLEIIKQDIQEFSKQYPTKHNDLFDLIICNPPFFSQHSKTQRSNELRHIARHTDSLSFKDLFSSINRLLTLNGAAYFLIPEVSFKEFLEVASVNNMVVVEQIDIAESDSHKAKVSVLKLIRDIRLEALGDQSINIRASLKRQRINKFLAPNQHSEEARILLSPFLLRYR